MLIITADDYGITPAATDAFLRCGLAARITSERATVLMAASKRSAALDSDCFVKRPMSERSNPQTTVFLTGMLTRMVSIGHCPSGTARGGVT